MSAKTGGSKINKMTKEITAKWGDVRTRWKDVKGDEFDKNYMEGLADRVSATATVIEEIDRVLTKIRKDCE